MQEPKTAPTCHQPKTVNPMAPDRRSHSIIKSVLSVFEYALHLCFHLVELAF